MPAQLEATKNTQRCRSADLPPVSEDATSSSKVALLSPGFAARLQLHCGGLVFGHFVTSLRPLGAPYRTGARFYCLTAAVVAAG